MGGDKEQRRGKREWVDIGKGERSENGGDREKRRGKREWVDIGKGERSDNGWR